MTAPPSVPTPAGVPAPPQPRFAWLDALRGCAALVVVAFHFAPQMIGTERQLAVMRWIDFGKYGVLLFFVVSGYVIPMSLERHGDLRRFWIGRLGRLYPAYLASIAMVATLAALGVRWQTSPFAESVTGLLAHATMMPDLVGLRGVLRVFWTLSYEMTFYLVVSGLFVWRLHRYSAWWAAGLGLTAVLAGSHLPDDLLGGTFADRRLLAGGLVIIVALSVIAYVKQRFVLIAGAVGLGLILLPAVNGHATRGSTVIASWQGLLLLAVMFAGTVVYRAQHGQIGRTAATVSLTVVALSVIGAHAIQLHTLVALRVWVLNVAAVGGTFLLAYAMRRRSVPVVLTWLGRISYSLYLLHPVVLFLIPGVVPDLETRPPLIRLGAGLAYFAIVLALAWLSYRMVELPGQRLARRWSAGRPPVVVAATQRAAPRTGRGENARQSV